MARNQSVEERISQSIEKRISQVFKKFNFLQESGLLQFWKCIESHDSEGHRWKIKLSDHCFRLTDPNHEGLKNYRRKSHITEGNRWKIELSDQAFRLTDRNHEGLKNYWTKSHDNVIRFVDGQEKVIGNWFAGRAAQTQIADHRTKDFVHSHHYQQDAEATGMGQYVMPVFDDGGDRKLVGIIELVTSVPKESYVEDFNVLVRLLKNGLALKDDEAADVGHCILPVFYDLGYEQFGGIIELVTSVAKESYVEDFCQLVQLLQARGIKSSYMEKTIRVIYDHRLIKFNLPISAMFTDLLKKTTKRFVELKNKSVCFKYDDTMRISNDEDLQKCMKESSSKGEAFIKLFVEHVDVTSDCTSGGDYVTPRLL